MTPITRKEFYLAKLTGDDVIVPDPVTREEVYLANLCGEDVEIPDPVTITEVYLAAMCGMEVEVPPPVTRLQTIWAGILGADIPEMIPYTREEFYWMNISLATYLTVVGNPVSFTAKAAPLRQLSVAFSPVQEGSGDPSPDNVRPILGWDSLNVEQRGGNLWDEQHRAGYYNNLTGEFISSAQAMANVNPIPVRPSTQYYSNAGSKHLIIYYYKADGTYISSLARNNVAFTTPADCAFINISTQYGDGSAYNNDISINYPATDHDYHAYNPLSRSISITIGSTVYSGTIDLISGAGEVTRGKTLFSDISSSYFGLTASGALRISNPAYTAIAFPNIKLPTSTSTPVDAICSMGKAVGSGPIAYRPEYDACFAFANGGAFYLVDTDCSSVDEYLAKYEDAVFVYALATPIPIQLTPQEVNSLAGDNTMWSNANQPITVSYRQN